MLIPLRDLMTLSGDGTKEVLSSFACSLDSDIELFLHERAMEFEKSPRHVLILHIIKVLVQRGLELPEAEGFPHAGRGGENADASLTTILTHRGYELLKSSDFEAVES